MLDRTVDYAKTRVQFGRPIGHFQAIQQQLALLGEEAAATDCAVRAAFRAAYKTDSGFEIGCAKLRANTAAAIANSIAHQVHAAIGFTHEYPLRHSTQRLWSWRGEFGNDRYWAERIGGEVIARGAACYWPDLTGPRRCPRRARWSRHFDRAVREEAVSRLAFLRQTPPFGWRHDHAECIHEMKNEEQTIVSNISFRGQVAIVTGAGNGLGKSYALELARRGAAVVVNDLGTGLDGAGATASFADAVVAEIMAAGGRAAANYDSCATRAGGEAIVDTALETFGRVDVLIHNAGFLRDAETEDLTDAQINAVIDVHP